MPRFTDDAVCIRHWDFSETSQTVSLFTRTHGLLRGLAKGSKRERGRFCGGIELLTRGQISAITKSTTDLATLTEWDLQEVFPSLHHNLKAYYAGLYCADLLGHMLSEMDPHERLFDVLVSVLRHISTHHTSGNTQDKTSSDSAAVGWGMLLFQWAILCETGYQPVLDRDAEQHNGNTIKAEGTLAFSAQAGGLVADTGSPDRWRVRSETIKLLRLLPNIDTLAKDNAISAWIASNTLKTMPITTPENTDNANGGGGGCGVDRANKLLAAYIRAILDRELHTMRYAVGELGIDRGRQPRKRLPR